TTTMPSLKSAVAALNEIKPNYNFKIIVGGAPVTQAFADEIGADGYAVDAGAAAIKAKEMVKDL
ncbi:MAG: cobalamin-binding protein, partial [Eubacteriaceae bacterium]|nr:cobalamin-binding protein [Eubacteriaceae bacterium]